MSIITNLWQKGGVCEETRSREESVAELKERTQWPDIDEKVSEALAKAETFVDGGQQWVVWTKEKLEKASGPSLVLCQAGWTTGWSNAEEWSRV